MAADRSSSPSGELVTAESLAAWRLPLAPRRSPVHRPPVPDMSSRPGPADLAALIDHTLLKPDATAVEIAHLCDEAVTNGFATVCVNPRRVAAAARLVAGSGVGVASVVGFPFGATCPDTKAYEARRAIFDGATEIDMVIDLGALKDDDLVAVRRDVTAVVDACREHGVCTKVIIEAALLTDGQKAAACTVAREAGADFVKTSTGFAGGGATVDDVRLMRQVVGPAMGVKAAGGIRSYAEAIALVAAGATRLGTSGSIAILAEAAREAGR